MKKQPNLSKALEELLKPEKSFPELYFSLGASDLSWTSDYMFSDQSRDSISNWEPGCNSFSVQAFEWYYEIVFSMAADEWDFESDITTQE